MLKSEGNRMKISQIKDWWWLLMIVVALGGGFLAVANEISDIRETPEKLSIVDEKVETIEDYIAEQKIANEYSQKQVDMLAEIVKNLIAE